LKKIIHLPTSTAGLGSGLSEIERRKNLNSKVFIEDQNKFGYQSDFQLNSKNFLIKFFLKLFFLLKNRKSFDIYHFNFGKSLFDLFYLGLPMLDLPVYKGRKVVTFNGSDIRGWTNKIYNDEVSKILDKSYSKNPKIKLKRIFFNRKIKQVEKYADYIFAVNPDLLNFLPRKAIFLPYAISNWYDINKIDFPNQREFFNIVHAPTNRGLKGSEYIINAVENLKKKYKNLNFTLVENVDHSKALEIYKKADLFIDQVLIGWYGGVSVEVMKMGIPVAVFIRQEDLVYLPKEMAIDLNNSVININPFNIESELEKVINDRKKLKKTAQLGFQYVNKWHDPEYIFKLLSKAYNLE